MKIPVLLIIYNRPQFVRQVLKQIEEYMPTTLYVYADGPKPFRNGDPILCKESRSIIDLAKMEFPLVRRYNQQNLGCKEAVSAAISWFFENEELGAILEDDCVPDQTFFIYCEELLRRYICERRIMCISGSSLIKEASLIEESYYYSRCPLIWGWATWRRAWATYDKSLRSESLAKLIWSIRRRRFGWRSTLKMTLLLSRVKSGKIDTWDFQWCYGLWKYDGLTCVPKRNLISNIGFGNFATHTRDYRSTLANQERLGLDIPLVHPRDIAVQESLDKYYEQRFM